MEGAAATVPPQRTGPKAMRGIARFCINTFRVFYARAAFARPAPVPLPSSSPTTAAAAATFSHRHRLVAATEEESSPSFEAMGNLQSDARRKGRKGKGGASTASSGSVEDGLEDVEAEDGGGEAEEETVGRKQEQEGSRLVGVEKRLTQKRQAPKPPPASTAERKVFFEIFLPRFCIHVREERRYVRFEGKEIDFWIETREIGRELEGRRGGCFDS